MTDAGGWEHLVRKERAPRGGLLDDVEPGSEYILAPVTEYQLANLMGLLKRTRQHDNGDWFWELVQLTCYVMHKMELAELQNNFGDTISLEALRSGTFFEDS